MIVLKREFPGQGHVSYIPVKMVWLERDHNVIRYRMLYPGWSADAADPAIPDICTDVNGTFTIFVDGVNVDTLKLLRDHP